MGIPNANPFGVAQPFRPAADAFGGCEMVNGINPPNPTTMPSAQQFNTLGLCAVAACSMVPSALVSIVETGGTYSVAWVIAPNTNILAGQIAITKNGTGDITIAISTALLPPETCTPTVTLNSDINASPRAMDYSATGLRGARVKIVTIAASPAAVDGNFTLSIY